MKYFHGISLFISALGGLMIFFPFLASILYQSGLRGPLSGSMFVIAGLGLGVIFLGLILWTFNEISPETSGDTKEEKK